MLSLVLKQGKSYAEIAGMLGIDEGAVRERAHAALGALAPTEGTPPPPKRRAAVADYLLGQQPAQDADQTRDYLASSASGRAWARVVADGLRPLAGDSVAEIPSGDSSAIADTTNGATGSAETDSAQATAAVAVAEATPPTRLPSDGAPGGAPPAATPPRRPRQPSASSKRAGAVLLGLVAAGVIALIVVLATGGSTHKAKPARAATGATTATPQIVGQINLTPPPGGGRAIGIGLIVAQGNQLALELQAQNLAPTTKSFGYGVWLYNSHTSAEAIGSAPPVGNNGRLSALAALPADTANFRSLILTRETSSRPTRPGPIVLSGRLPGR